MSVVDWVFLPVIALLLLWLLAAELNLARHEWLRQRAAREKLEQAHDSRMRGAP